MRDNEPFEAWWATLSPEEQLHLLGIKDYVLEAWWDGYNFGYDEPHYKD